MAKRIGFIGVGLMGHGAAKNILEGGFPLTVLAHRNREPVDDLDQARCGGGKLCGRARRRLVDIIFTCVSDSRVMESRSCMAKAACSAVRSPAWSWWT